LFYIPEVSFLSHKKEILEIPLEEEESFKTCINPLALENSQVILNYLDMAWKIPQLQQPPPPLPPRVFNKFIARYAPLNLPSNLHDCRDNYVKSYQNLMEKVKL